MVVYGLNAPVLLCLLAAPAVLSRHVRLEDGEEINLQWSGFNFLGNWVKVSDKLEGEI